MSRCVSDIFVYVHDIYADSFLSAYCPYCLLIKIKKVGGCWQPATRDVRQRNRTSFKLNARGKSEIFFFYHSFSKITPVLQALLCPSSPGCPGLTVLLRAFLWTSSEAATITLLLFCKSFLYNYIYIYIHVYIRISFSVMSFYFGDTGGIFCSLPACLWPPWGELRRACGWRL